MRKLLQRAVPVLAAAGLLGPVLPASTVLASAALPASAAGTPGAAGPAPVPAGFQPASASFLSAASGFVLGAVGCKPRQACRARLISTADGGAHWRFRPAPGVRLPDPAGVARPPEVSNVLFASRRVGWLYGPGLWFTTDRGAHWRRLRLGADIVAMAASAGIGYALVSYRGGADELLRSPVGRNAWRRAGSMTGDPLASLAVSGRAAWFGTSSALWATADGRHWHRNPFHCRGKFYQLASIAAASATHLKLLCVNSADYSTAQEAVEVMTSADGGRTVHLTGRTGPIIGDSGVIAVPPRRPAIISFATSVGTPSWLGRSADGGRTLRQVASFADGFTWNSLGYVSRTVGWIVLGQPAIGGVTELLRTSDAGRTWRQVGF